MVTYRPTYVATYVHHIAMDLGSYTYSYRYYTITFSCPVIGHSSCPDINKVAPLLAQLTICVITAKSSIKSMHT